MKTCLALAVCLGPAAASEWNGLESGSDPTPWAGALPLTGRRQAAFVLDSPAWTLLRGSLSPLPHFQILKPEQFRGQVADFFGHLPNVEAVDLKIQWLFQEMEVGDFTRAVADGEGRLRSSCRLGDATVTRTVVGGAVGDAIFLHFLADKPGLLSFRASLSGAPPFKLQVEDRRGLILLPVGDPSSRPRSEALVLPFEADVTPGDGCLEVLGEGEALIIWTYCAENVPSRRPLEIFSALGQQYDPGHSPPDPSRIWQGILANFPKSTDNSP